MAVKPASSKRKRLNTKWINNAMRSIGGAYGNAFSEIMPNISQPAKDITQSTKDAIGSIRKSGQSANKIGNVLANNKLIKGGQDLIKNAFEEIKSGDFSGGSSDTSFSSELDGLMDGSDNNNEGGFTFNYIDGDSSNESAQLSSTIRTTAEAQLKASKATVDTMVSVASVGLMHNQQMNDEIISRLDSINDNLANIIKYHNENTTKFYEASLAMYDKLGSKMDSNGNSNNINNNNDDDGPFGITGKFDFNAYKKTLKKNIKSQIEGNEIGAMLSPILDDDTTLKMFISNPIGTAMPMIVANTIPKAMKQSLSSLDATFKDFVPTMLEQISDWGKEEGAGIVKKIIGNIFGFKEEDIKKFGNISGKVNKDAATFDGLVRNSIVEVIPKYLRESNQYLKAIAETVTKRSSSSILQGAEFFDPNTNSYKTSSKLKKDIADRIVSSTTDAFGSTRFNKSIRSSIGTLDKKSSKRGNELIDQLERLLVERDISYKDIANDSYSKGGKVYELINSIGNGSKSDKDLLKILTQAMRNIAADPNITDYTHAKNTAKRNKRETIRSLSDNYDLHNLVGLGLTGDTDIESFLDDVYGNLKISNRRREYEKAIARKEAREDYRIRKANKGKSTAQLANNGMYGSDTVPTRDVEDNYNNMGSSVSGFVQGTVKGLQGSMIALMRGDSTGAMKSLAGIFTGHMKSFMEAANEGFFKPLKNQIFGEKDENGNRSHGLFAGIQNKANDIWKSIGHAINGKSYIKSDGTTVAEANPEDTVVGKVAGIFNRLKESVGYKLFGKDGDTDEEEGLINKGMRTLKDGLTGWKNALFGTDDKEAQKSTIESIKKKLHDNLPDALTGSLIGGLGGTLSGGLLGTLVGGPIGGALIGFAGSFLTKSDKFKDYLFGPEIEDENGYKRRLGGLISSKVQNIFKSDKTKKSALAGALIGGVKSLVFGGPGGILGSLVGGPIGGALIGGALGIIKESESFKRLLYGEEGAENGLKHILKRAFKPKKLSKDEEKQAKDMGMPIVGSLAGAGIMGMAFGPAGIIGGSLLGLGAGIKAQGQNIKTWLFGEKDAEGNRTKVGVLGKFGNMIHAELLAPMRSGLDNMINDAKTALDNIADSTKIIIQPFLNTASKIKDRVTNIFTKTGGKITALIKQDLIPVVSNLLVKPIKQVVGTGAKILYKGILASIQSPFNLMRNAVLSIHNNITRRISNFVKGTIDPIKHYVKARLKDGWEWLKETRLGRIAKKSKELAKAGLKKAASIPIDYIRGAKGAISNELFYQLNAHDDRVIAKRDKRRKKTREQADANIKKFQEKYDNAKNDRTRAFYLEKIKYWESVKNNPGLLNDDRIVRRKENRKNAREERRLNSIRDKNRAKMARATKYQEKDFTIENYLKLKNDPNFKGTFEDEEGIKEVIKKVEGYEKEIGVLQRRLASASDEEKDEIQRQIDEARASMEKIYATKFDMTKEIADKVSKKSNAELATVADETELTPEERQIGILENTKDEVSGIKSIVSRMFAFFTGSNETEEEDEEDSNSAELDNSKSGPRVSVGLNAAESTNDDSGIIQSELSGINSLSSSTNSDNITYDDATGEAEFSGSSSSTNASIDVSTVNSAEEADDIADAKRAEIDKAEKTEDLTEVQNENSYNARLEREAAEKRNKHEDDQRERIAAGIEESNKENKKHHFEWDKIFNKKGLITAAMIALGPKIIKDLPKAWKWSKEHLFPIFESIGKIGKTIYDNALKPLINNIIVPAFTKFLFPAAKWTVETLGTVLTAGLNGIGAGLDAIFHPIKSIKSLIGGIGSLFGLTGKENEASDTTKHKAGKLGISAGMTALFRKLTKDGTKPKVKPSMGSRIKGTIDNLFTKLGNSGTKHALEADARKAAEKAAREAEKANSALSRAEREAIRDKAYEDEYKRFMKESGDDVGKSKPKLSLEEMVDDMVDENGNFNPIETTNGASLTDDFARYGDDAVEAGSKKWRTQFADYAKGRFKDSKLGRFTDKIRHPWQTIKNKGHDWWYNKSRVKKTIDFIRHPIKESKRIASGLKVVKGAKKFGRGVKKVGRGIKNGIGFVRNTPTKLRNLNASLTDNASKAVSKVDDLAAKWTKASSKNADDIVKNANKKGGNKIIRAIGSKIQSFLASVSAKLATKAAVGAQKAMKNMGDNLVERITKCLMEKCASFLDKIAVKMASETTLAAITGGISILIGGLIGALDGVTSAAKIFRVNKKNVDGKMTAISALLGALQYLPYVGVVYMVIDLVAPFIPEVFGVLGKPLSEAEATTRANNNLDNGIEPEFSEVGFDFTNWLATLMYKAWASSEDYVTLLKNQDAFITEYNEKTDNSLKAQFKSQKAAGIIDQSLSFNEFKERQKKTKGKDVRIQSFDDYNTKQNGGMMDKAMDGGATLIKKGINILDIAYNDGLDMYNDDSTATLYVEDPNDSDFFHVYKPSKENKYGMVDPSSLTKGWEMIGEGVNRDSIPRLAKQHRISKKYEKGNYVQKGAQYALNPWSLAYDFVTDRSGKEKEQEKELKAQNEKRKQTIDAQNAIEKAKKEQQNKIEEQKKQAKINKREASDRGKIEKLLKDTKIFFNKRLKVYIDKHLNVYTENGSIILTREEFISENSSGSGLSKMGNALSMKTRVYDNTRSYNFNPLSDNERSLEYLKNLYQDYIFLENTLSYRAVIEAYNKKILIITAIPDFLKNQVHEEDVKYKSHKSEHEKELDNIATKKQRKKEAKKHEKSWRQARKKLQELLGDKYVLYSEKEKVYVDKWRNVYSTQYIKLLVIGEDAPAEATAHLSAPNDSHDSITQGQFARKLSYEFVIEQYNKGNLKKVKIPKELKEISRKNHEDARLDKSLNKIEKKRALDGRKKNDQLQRKYQSGVSILSNEEKEKLNKKLKDNNKKYLSEENYKGNPLKDAFWVVVDDKLDEVYGQFSFFVYYEDSKTFSHYSNPGVDSSNNPITCSILESYIGGEAAEQIYAFIRLGYIQGISNIKTIAADGSESKITYDYEFYKKARDVAWGTNSNSAIEQQRKNAIALENVRKNEAELIRKAGGDRRKVYFDPNTNKQNALIIAQQNSTVMNQTGGHSFGGFGDDWSFTPISTKSIDSVVKSIDDLTTKFNDMKITDDGGFGKDTRNGFSYYSQTDPRWSSKSYSNNDAMTMHDAGCGPSAMAMVTSQLKGRHITPDMIAADAQAGGYRDSTGTNSQFMTDEARRFGLNTLSKKNPTGRDITTELRKGRPVILGGYKEGSGRSAFSDGGHYVVAVGEDGNGNIIVNDPRGKGYSGKYNANRLASETYRGWSYGNGYGGFGYKKPIYVVKDGHYGWAGYNKQKYWIMNFDDINPNDYTWIANNYVKRDFGITSDNHDHSPGTKEFEYLYQNPNITKTFDKVISEKTYKRIVEAANAGKSSGNTNKKSGKKDKKNTEEATVTVNTTDTLGSSSTDTTSTGAVGPNGIGWMDAVVTAKKLIAEAAKAKGLQPTEGSPSSAYYQSGNIEIEFNGKKYTVRRDCSGYVSAAVQLYQGSTDFGMPASSGFSGDSSIASKLESLGFKKASWNGYESLTQGDIMSSSGQHVQIMDSMDGSSCKVYSNGSGKSVLNPESENCNTSTTYDTVWICPNSTMNGTSLDGSATLATSEENDQLTKISNAFSAYARNAQSYALGGKYQDVTVADILGTSTSTSGSATTSGAATTDASNLQGGDTAEKVWNYLKSAGYSDAAAAGVLGNMEQESGVDPAKIQGNGAGPAAGIVQWENYNTKSGRWKSMSDYAKSKGKDWTDLGSQLEFMDKEFGSSSMQAFFKKSASGMANSGAKNPIGYNEFKQLTDAEEATRQFEGAFERAGKPMMDKRISAANAYLQKFQGKGSGAGFGGFGFGDEDAEFVRSSNKIMYDSISNLNKYGDEAIKSIDGGFGRPIRHLGNKQTTFRNSNSTKSYNTNNYMDTSTMESILRNVLSVLQSIDGNTETSMRNLRDIKNGDSQLNVNNTTVINGGNTYTNQTKQPGGNRNGKVSRNGVLAQQIASGK